MVTRRHTRNERNEEECHTNAQAGAEKQSSYAAGGDASGTTALGNRQFIFIFGSFFTS